MPRSSATVTARRQQWWTIHPGGLRLALTLTLLLVSVPPSAMAESPYHLVAPQITPDRAAPGTPLRVSFTVQARGGPGLSVLTVTVTTSDDSGQERDSMTLAGQRFGSWQSRRYDIDWRVPVDQPGDTLLIGVRVVNEEASEVLAWQASVPVARAVDAAPPADPAPPTEPAPAPADEPDRSPRRCAAEFQVIGGEGFLAVVRDHLAYIDRVSPNDYAMIMTCDLATDATRVTRIVQVGPPFSDKRGPYSDASGTIWLGAGTGPAAASLLVHEAAHINRTGWNTRGSSDCGPENEALEWQASFLGRAALMEVEQRDDLLRLANWLREQKNVHNCPAR